MYRVLEPLETAKIKFKNRLIMPPMATQKCGPNGEINDAVVQHYRERAKGAYLALIIIENSYVDMAGKGMANMMSAADDDMIYGMEKLAAAIHAEGVPAVMQLNHAGAATTREITGLEVVAPSAVKSEFVPGDDLPRPLTAAEIKKIISQFAAAAGRVRSAGFDGVEIHSAHGYLLSQFLSPLSNQRRDQYGGSLEKRMAIHREVIAAVRQAVGGDYPIFLRLGACDYAAGGNTIEDGVWAARLCVEAGVDILDVSGGLCLQHPTNTGPGYFADAAAAIKGAVTVPVILTGGVRRIQEAEKLLAAGSADLIGVGKELLADPAWAKKQMDTLT